MEFDTPPITSFAPSPGKNRIGLAVIEEFIHGSNLDHYFRKAIYEGMGSFFEKETFEAGLLFIYLT